MRYQDHRLRQPAEQLDQPLAGGLVEFAGGLVQQQDVGLHRQHGGQGDQPFFAAGEAVGDAMFVVLPVPATGACGRRCGGLHRAAFPDSAAQRPRLPPRWGKTTGRRRPERAARRGGELHENRPLRGGPCRRPRCGRPWAATAPRSGAAASSCRCRWYPTGPGAGRPPGGTSSRRAPAGPARRRTPRRAFNQRIAHSQFTRASKTSQQ